MEGNSPKECGICNNLFNEDERCPRNLPCSHCFCSSCIGQLIVRNDKKCPFCRNTFQATKVEDVGKNTTTLDLLRYIRDLESKVSRCPPRSRSELVEEMKKSSIETNNQNLSFSKEAVVELKTAIENNRNLKINIGRTLLKLKNNINFKIRELETKCAINLQYFEEEDQRLEDQVKKSEKKQQECDRVKTLLDTATSAGMADSAVDEAEASDEAFQTWRITFEKTISTDKKISQSMKNIAEKMRVICEVLASPTNEDISIAEELASITLQEENQTQITPQILQRMSTTTQCLVSLEGIYAVKQTEGSRCARISINENKVFLHALRDEQLPLNVCTIEHDDVMRLMNPSSRLTFLELGDEESVLGRVYVRLSPNTKRAKNFSVLCTGEMGPTYLGTSITVREEVGEERILFGGAYVINGTEQREALIPGSGKEEGGVLQKPILPGSLIGISKTFQIAKEMDPEAMASVFMIVPTGHADKVCPTVFGMTESGLDILNAITFLYPRDGKVSIRDCGIVLSQ